MARLVALFILALTVYGGTLPHRIDALRFFKPLGVDAPVPTGDEPYYLEIAHSIVYDGDLDLTNNHDVRRDYWRFYPLDLIPHRSNTVLPGHYSKHYPGLALLITPFYWLGDHVWIGPVTASRAVVAAFLCIVAAVLAVNSYLLARETVGNAMIALAVFVAFAFTNPAMSYSFLIFPETPAALCAVYVFRRAWLGADGPARSAIVGFALGLLPWLHPRLLLLAAPLGLLYLVRCRPRGWRLVTLGTPVITAGTLFIAYDLWLYASPIPNLQDHAGMSFGMWTARGLIGLLLDQQWGLLIHAPVYVVAILGLVPLVRNGGSRGRWLVAATVPYLIFIASYKQWWGEWCPPGRYLLPMLPLLIQPLALALARTRAGGRATFVALLVPSLAVSAIFAAEPSLMYNHPTGQSQLLYWLGDRFHIDLTAWAPTLVVPNDRTVPLAIGWLLAIATVLALGHLLDRLLHLPVPSVRVPLARERHGN